MRSQFERDSARSGLFIAFLALSALPAAAHHAMGGEVPATLWQGLVSGIAHPVIGFDHFAFVVAVGIASAFAGWRYVSPLVFVAATIAGCLLGLSIGSFAVLELAIAASVTLIGIMVLSGRAVSAATLAALFAIAGLLHGAAYAGSIVGAEPTPLAAYLAGFAAIQYAIAATMTWITRETWQASSTIALQPRLTGAVVAGIGAAFLVENVEALVFAAT